MNSIRWKMKLPGWNVCKPAGDGSQIDPLPGSVVNFILGSSPGGNGHLEADDEEAELANDVLLDLIVRGVSDSATLMIFENAQDLDSESWELIRNASSQ